MLTLYIREGAGNRACLNRKDAEKLSVNERDLIKVTDDHTGLGVVVSLKINPKTPPGHIELDPYMIDSIGSVEGGLVNIYKFLGKPVKLLSLTLGIKPVVRMDDALIKIRERENELMNLLNGLVIALGQKFRWEEMNVVITFLKTEPDLTSGHVGIITPDIRKSLRYKLETDEPPFDGILLIDLSESMKIADMRVRNIAHIMNYIEDEQSDILIKKFLRNFVEGKPTKRYLGATLSAILYLVAKVARGKGERIGVILFSHKAVALKFDGKNYFEASGDTERIIKNLIENVEKFGKYTTNMSGAFSKAIEIIKNFELSKMKMLVLLTDGQPDDKERVEEIVKKRLAPRSDVMLFIAGIGEEVNTNFMRSLTGACGGEYIHVTDLSELIDWYQGLARKLSVKARPSG